MFASQAAKNEFHAQAAVMSHLEATDDLGHKAAIQDIANQGIMANISWKKILVAVSIAAAGGFSQEAIAAAIASMFSA